VAKRESESRLGQNKASRHTRTDATLSCWTVADPIGICRLQLHECDYEYDGEEDGTNSAKPKPKGGFYPV
jgi:hypothetical protein